MNLVICDAISNMHLFSLRMTATPAPLSHTPMASARPIMRLYGCGKWLVEAFLTSQPAGSYCE